MTFLEALDQVILGKKVRRENWADGAYLQRSKRTIKIKYALYGALIDFIPVRYELISDNWEVIP